MTFTRLIYTESIVNQSTRINPKFTVNRLQATDLTGEKEKLTREEDGRALRQAVDATTSWELIYCKSIDQHQYKIYCKSIGRREVNLL